MCVLFKCVNVNNESSIHHASKHRKNCVTLCFAKTTARDDCGKIITGSITAQGHSSLFEKYQNFFQIMLNHYCDNKYTMLECVSISQADNLISKQQ